MTNGINEILKIVDFCVVFLVVQFGRCALLSFIILGIVMFIRAFVLRNQVFLKGMLWSVFLIVPFLGKLKVFYGDSFVTVPFLYWQALCVKYVWVRYGYLVGVVASVVWLYFQHRKGVEVFRNLKAETTQDGQVFISMYPVSPFSTGLLKPKIIIPSVIKEHFDNSELETILLHERMHIQLGHIWIFMFWKCLSVLLWMNPFLLKSMYKLKEDMELICDRVTIYKSGIDAKGYGKLVIKSMTLLRAEMNDAVTFTGEKDFVSARERIRQIRDYTPYKKSRIVIIAVCGTACVLSLMAFVSKISYPRYTESTDVVVMDEKYQTIVQGNTKTLDYIIDFRKNEVVINNHAFLEMIENKGTEQSIYYICWGGFMKLPGIAGGGNEIVVENLSEGEKTIVPYKNAEKDLRIKFMRWL